MTLKDASRIRRRKTLRAVGALVLREMETTYGRSPGGYVWAVLEPVAAIMLLSVAFSVALRAPSLGTSFALFYATGYLPFMMFLDISNKIGNAIRFSRPLLNYPSVTYLDAILARFVLNVLTQVMVFYIVILGIFLTLETRALIDLPPILNAMAMAAVLGLGVGALNCFLFNWFPVWERIWGIATRPLFIISGIFFLPEDVPAPYDFWLTLNPVVHVIGEMRRGFYPAYEAAFVDYTYVYAIGLICLFFALVLLGRYHRDILGAN